MSKQYIMRKPKIFQRRKLPHIQPPGATFFVTYLLHGAMPAPLMEKLKAENEFNLMALKSKENKLAIDEENRRYFGKFDETLNRVNNGVDWLKDEKLAQIVASTWHYWDDKRLELMAYCIMCNHVHVVFRLFEQNELGAPLYLQHIMETVKKYTARQCNLILERTGQPFWQHESYDRVARNQDELYRIIAYTLDNPVKAGLCTNRQDWQWSYIKEDYNEFM